jgi:hypothetical protein
MKFGMSEDLPETLEARQYFLCFLIFFIFAGGQCGFAATEGLRFSRKSRITQIHGGHGRLSRARAAYKDLCPLSGKPLEG